MSRVKLALVVMVGCLVTAAAQPVLAQQQQQRGNRGGGNFDPAQFRQRQMDRIKEQLGATDDEWKVIQPKLEKVMDAQREARMGGFGGRRGRGGDNGGGTPAPGADTDVAKAAAALRAALDDKATPADEIQKKLTALRDARTKAHDTLAAAQKDLKDILTQRQEATLVVNGMLE